MKTVDDDVSKLSQKDSDEDVEVIEEDDLCAICHLLLYRPVTTQCRHTLCESCMAQWADVSISTQMTRVGLDDEAMVLLPHEIETKCPMCRTSTTASSDVARETMLRDRYPHTYQNRQAEEATSEADDTVEALTLYIGNTHELVRADDDRPGNKHSWKFFLRPSRTDLIEEVHLFLHPTFSTPRIVLLNPPYEIRRLGWGYFTILVGVILKAGYSWVSDEAEDAPDGGRNGKLPLEWTLNFEGNGNQGRYRLKVRKEKEGQEVEDERQREAVRQLWVQQQEEDPDWIDE